MKLSKGFTLIELLIVIAVLGILIVAILSALDPLEQVRKARDSGRQNDAAEFIKSVERYFTTYGCHPWDTAPPTGCVADPATNIVRVGGAVDAEIAANAAIIDTGIAQMVAQGEVKSGFGNRQNFNDTDKLWITEHTDRGISVCFEPESRAIRNGSGAVRTTNTNDGTSVTAGVCGGAYGNNAAGGTCFVCLPQ